MRVLRQIPLANQAHAHRMLQCLMVAVRPLRVEELAELLAFEFDAAQGGIPKYRGAWRLDDQTQAVLSTCSSLVTIVDSEDGGRIVQFSHFSVKEFLMSDRLGNLSRYHIHPISAHTILTQACLGVLLHLDHRIDKESVKSLPLSEYAAQHWVEHAQYGDVASRVKAGMETLFNPYKPHFATWIGIHDIENPMGHWRHFPHLGISPNPTPNPLYYSVLCGFYFLVMHLATKHPPFVNAICGQYRFPLFAALSADHFDIAELLLEHGADVNVRDTMGETILLKVLSRPQRNLVNKVRLLLKHAADVNAFDVALKSPLHLAESEGEFEVAQILIKHKADVSSPDIDGKTPLHVLSERWTRNESDVLNHARFLLEHGAEANRRDKNNQTPLLLAMGRGWFKLARILLQYGADANAENDNGMTPLQLLSEYLTYNEGDVLNPARFLLQHGAEANRRDRNNQTPLLLAMGRGWFKLARILLDYGADANAENNNGMTSLHILSERHYDKNDVGDAPYRTRSPREDVVEVNRRYKDDETPSLLEIGMGIYKSTWHLLSFSQMFRWKTKRAKPWRIKYHQVNTAPRNVASLHKYYLIAACTSVRKKTASTGHRHIYSPILVRSRLHMPCLTRAQTSMQGTMWVKPPCAKS